jgi:hypothetical protein
MRTVACEPSHHNSSDSRASARGRLAQSTIDLTDTGDSVAKRRLAAVRRRLQFVEGTGWMKLRKPQIDFTELCDPAIIDLARRHAWSSETGAADAVVGHAPLEQHQLQAPFKTVGDG